MFRKDIPTKYIPRGITLITNKPTYRFFAWDRYKVESRIHGVYVFYDKEGTVVYVGESENLMKRVVHEHLLGFGDRAFEYFFTVSFMNCLIQSIYLLKKHGLV